MFGKAKNINVLFVKDNLDLIEFVSQTLSIQVENGQVGATAG